MTIITSISLIVLFFLVTIIFVTIADILNRVRILENWLCMTDDSIDDIYTILDNFITPEIKEDKTLTKRSK
jgi:hypothetical protein